jgi:DNA-directed RNA polymerase subunit M/transcription elongation factor TFIIS
MPLAHEVKEPCPRCDSDSNVWVYEKDEPTITKEHYTCQTCGHAWTEVRQD